MISFFKDISTSGYDDKDDIKKVIDIIRNGIFGYLFSGYKLTSKLYGIFISIFPSWALKVFRSKDND